MGGEEKTVRSDAQLRAIRARHHYRRDHGLDQGGRTLAAGRPEGRHYEYGGQALRPYPQYGTINTTNSGGDKTGRSMHHAAVLKLTQRLNDGQFAQAVLVARQEIRRPEVS